MCVEISGVCVCMCVFFQAPPSGTSVRDKPTHLDSWCPNGSPQSEPPQLGSAHSSAQTADREVKRSHSHSHSFDQIVFAGRPEL